MNCVDPKVNKSRTSDIGSKRKTVRIASKPQVIMGVEKLGEMSNEERFQKWWQPDELERSRVFTRSLGQKMRQEGDPKRCLTDAYDLACSIAAFEGDLDTVHSTRVLTSDEDLLHWCSCTSDVRGLERWACPEFALSRIKQVNEVRNAVFREQSRQLFLEHRDEEAIARVAQVKSRNSRVFAALLGRADAVAAKQQEILKSWSSLHGQRNQTESRAIRRSNIQTNYHLDLSKLFSNLS